MIICPKCDAENPKGQQFCTQCKTFLGQTPFSMVLLAWAMILTAYFFLITTLISSLSIIIEPFGLVLGLKLGGAVYAVLAGGYLLKLKGWSWILSLVGFLGIAGFGGYHTLLFILNDFQPDWVEMVPNFAYLLLGAVCLIVLFVNSRYYFMNPDRKPKKPALKKAAG